MRWNIPNANRILLLSMLSLVIIGRVAVQAAIDGPANIRGTISNVSGNALKVTGNNGRTENVALSDDAKIVVVNSASLEDIKPEGYIGVTAKPKPDGALEALEVHIFPPSMRGVGEGTRNWDLVANSSMTNGTVAKVDAITGGKVTVSYRGGEKSISIAPSTKIVTLTPGNRDQLKPGIQAFIPAASRQPDGTLQASRITIAGNAAPPM